MYPELLKHIKRFIPLSPAEEELIGQYFIPLKTKKKEILLDPGKVCKGQYFVVSGLVRLYFITHKLNEQITQFGLENWWIADHDSLFNQKPSTVYLQTVDASQLLLLTPQNQQLLFKAVPQMESYFRLIYQKAVAASQRRMEYIFMSDEERYRQFAELFPWFLQRVPQYMLASYLGFTPQFMSRLRGRKIV